MFHRLGTKDSFATPGFATLPPAATDLGCNLFLDPSESVARLAHVCLAAIRVCGTPQESGTYEVGTKPPRLRLQRLEALPSSGPIKRASCQILPPSVDTSTF